MSDKITANCPYCDYIFSIDESAEECFCQSCGKKLRIDNGTVTADSDEMEKYNKSLKSWNITSFAIGLILLICNIIFAISGSMLCLFVSVAFSIFGPVAIALTEPDGSNIKNSDLRKPNRVITWLKYTAVFLLLGAIALAVDMFTYGMNRAGY
jgi:magnesium-transporting ATPase (P-type)